MTLIEVLIVMGLMALILGAVVVGSGQRNSAKLHHSATMMTGAIRVAYSRATATSKTIRLVMDFEANELWLEEGDQPHLVQSKDVTGTGGATAATEAERQALAESSRIMTGPPIPKATFREIDAMGVAASEPGKGHKKLDGGITFRQVQSQHDDAPRKEGRAYLYFWPGGNTERCAIQLRVGPKPAEGREETGTTVTLLVQPLTARVHVKDGAVDMPAPKDDKEGSEREDPGAF
jgi:general secretion pathway protein H